MSDSSSLSSCSSSSSDCSDNSVFDLLPNRKIIEKFKDYEADISTFVDESIDVFKVDYSKKFMKTYAIFQEALRKNEISERCLDLTKLCISLNAANYTVWYFRRILLFELQKDLYQELNYIDKLILENQKNYQIWQHRKCIVKRLKDASKEKEFTKKVLMNESKNYHAWQYRQWFISKFNLYDGEIQETTDFLKIDLRNNSAWNHRFYVMKNLNKFDDKKCDEFKKEVLFVLEHIKLSLNNESSWNYLVGILGEENLNDNEDVNLFIENLDGKNNSSFFYSFKLDQIMAKLKKQNNIQLAQNAIEIANSLANVYDKIRKKYWEYVASTIKENYLA